MRLGTVLLFVLSIVVLCSLPLHATTYYVSSSTGNDTWSGTRQTPDGENGPWKTLKKVSSITFQPGDRILLKCSDIWSGEELILKGNGDYATGTWITLGSYGSGAKPRITSPPFDLTPGLVSWSAVNEAYPGTDRNFMKIAIRLDATLGGWVFRGLEIDTAEMGIYSKRGLNHAHVLIEDCYFHDILGLKMPKIPTWEQNTIMWVPYPEPAWGSAIDVSGDYLTVRDVVIERATGGVGRFTYGGVLENVYMDKIWSGGLSMNGHAIRVRYATVHDAQWPDGAWFGVDPIILGACTDYVVERCEISDTQIFGTGGDAAAIDFDQGNFNCVMRDCFIANNYGPATEYHLAGDNRQIIVDNNVCFRNGHRILEGPNQEPAFSIDAAVFQPGAIVTITNNKIYKNFADQPVNFYYDGSGPPQYGQYTDGWTSHKGYTTSNNTVYEYGSYSLPLPIPTPPAITQTNIAAGASVTVSSGGDSASLAQDSSLTTEWVSTEAAPWIRYSWESPQRTDTIRLFDRADLDNRCTSGTLTFSDGSSINVTGGILNNGAMREVTFDAKCVTWVQFTVTRNIGAANGLTDFQVYAAGTPPPAPPKPDPGTFTIDFESRPKAAARITGLYPNNPNGIDWKAADWTTKAEEGNRYLYADFSGQVWIWRIFVLPKGKVLKSLKVSGPEGSTVGISNTGQADGFLIRPTPEFSTYDSGWVASKLFSDIVVIAIDLTKVTGKDVTDVRIDDIVYGD